MPTLDWLHRDAAFRLADAVPYRLLEPVSRHGDGSAIERFAGILGDHRPEGGEVTRR